MSDTSASASSASGPDSSTTIPVIVRSQEFVLSSPFDDLPGSQTAQVHFAMNYAPITDAATKKNLWLWVSLYGTTASAAGEGSLIANSNSAVGWYLSGTTVQIDVGSGFTYVQVAPETQECSGTVSSSLSVSGGFFGDTPTGSVGFTRSYAENITDLLITDDSGPSVLQHYTMSASTGGAYQQPSDLLDTGAFSHTLYGVPAVATANLPIITQAYWLAPANFNGDVSLQVEITLQYSFVKVVTTPVLAAEIIDPFLAVDTESPTQSQQVTQVANFNFTVPFTY